MRSDPIKPLRSLPRRSLSAEQLQQFGTKEQRQALQRHNDEALKQADERALAEALLASLADLRQESPVDHSPALPAPASSAPAPDHQPASATGNSPDAKKNISASSRIPEAYYEGNRKINRQLRGWLQDHGFSLISNTGKDANCLLISMVQHAKRHYDSEHDAEVNDLREKAKDYTRRHHPDNPSINDYSLNSDDGLTVELVREINKDIKDSKEKLSFCFVTADIDGQPLWKRIGDGERVAIIFDQGGHFEAVIPRQIASTHPPTSQAPR